LKGTDGKMESERRFFCRRVSSIQFKSELRAYWTNRSVIAQSEACGVTVFVFEFDIGDFNCAAVIKQNPAKIAPERKAEFCSDKEEMAVEEHIHCLIRF